MEAQRKAMRSEHQARAGDHQTPLLGGPEDEAAAPAAHADQHEALRLQGVEKDKVMGTPHRQTESVVAAGGRLDAQQVEKAQMEKERTPEAAGIQDFKRQERCQDSGARGQSEWPGAGKSEAGEHGLRVAPGHEGRQAGDAAVTTGGEEQQE